MTNGGRHIRDQDFVMGKARWTLNSKAQPTIGIPAFSPVFGATHSVSS
jgi:hypothetical protein